MTPKPGKGQWGLSAVFAAGLCMSLAGCGTPGAPQPPSLNLPDRVTDLNAVRAGNRVSLSWTMPRRNTDKLPLKGSVDVRVCRREGVGDGTDRCVPVGQLQAAPAARPTFAETLSGALASGEPRPLSYFVELKNDNGRSAGLSNAASALAGEAPSPVAGLAAQVRKDAVVLRWNADGSAAAIRLQRKLLTLQPAQQSEGSLPRAQAPGEQNLIVESNAGTPGVALDKSISVGNTYEYRAQRVTRQSVDGKTVELDSELSAPIRVEALDVFPPAVPTGLAAVATAPDAATGAAASIDLNWQPNTEADLAGYEVYRREETTAWEKISGDQPVAGPAYHDAQVDAGHTYSYGVSAVDKAGHESARSAEAQETVPKP